jgi:thrombospondin motif-containing protein 9
MSLCGYLYGKEMVDESIPYGTTRFNKIRLNIHNLQVIENDYTFASTVGKPQPFASAGDCYSSTEMCPQGDFSVNLEGTGFRIRPSTKWDVKGQNATMRMVIDVSCFLYNLQVSINHIS